MTWATAHREGAVAAQYCLADHEVDTSAQIDVFKTLRERGILAVFRPLPKLSGAYFPNDGRPGVLLNANHPMSKQRYTAAHELGHDYLEHGTSVDPEIDALHRWGDRPPPQKEMVAEAFAAWFLMPHRLVMSVLERYGREVREPRDAYALSLRLGTSYQATTRHLANLRIITRRVAESWVRTPPRQIKRELAGDWSPPDIRNEVWVVGTADDGVPVTVTPGDRVIVKAPEIPSSGYSWNPAEDPTAPGITVVGEDYAGPSELAGAADPAHSLVVGGSADHLIVLEVDDDAPEGASPLTFVHSQPWNPDSETDRFTVDVRVRHYVRGAHESYFLESAA